MIFAPSSRSFRYWLCWYVIFFEGYLDSRNAYESYLTKPYELLMPNWENSSELASNNLGSSQNFRQKALNLITEGFDSKIIAAILNFSRTNGGGGQITSFPNYLLKVIRLRKYFEHLRLRYVGVFTSFARNSWPILGQFAPPNF